MPERSGITRRHFTAAIAASSLGRVSGAGERLRVGVIGCGGMAMGHMRTLQKMKEADNVEVAAVCDIFKPRAQRAAELTGGNIVADYRNLLDTKDIDYVLIATPEHWHAQMTLDAVAAGKHVYCEKPMTWSVEQARKVVAAVRNSKLKVQVGVQGMSDDSYAAAFERVKAGDLGEVVLAQIDYSRNYRNDFWTAPPDFDAKPGENLDWRAWLGPAEKHDFVPDRFYHWRRYWDYSGGIASDLFVHRATRMIRSLGLTFPEYGVATGGKFFWTSSPAEIPDTFNILLDYPEGLTVQLVSSMANDTPVEHMLRGNKATLYFTRTGFTIKPQQLFADEAKEFTFQKTGSESIELHHRNLMNAIRHGEPLNCDVMLGYYGVVACQMGVQSYRRRQYLAWDKQRERFTRA